MINKLKTSLAVQQHVLQATMKSNEQHQTHMDKLDALTKRDQSLATYESVIRNMKRKAVTLAENYRESRIGYLEQEIENNLAYLIPEENFRVKIEFSSRDGVENANLYIMKKGGTRWSLPKARNGRFIRQIISFTAMYTINRLRGSKTIFSDEALASADKKNLLNLKPMLDNLIDDGFQIVVIEHKPELYQTLDRREFKLVKDRRLGYLTIEGVKDYVQSE